MGEDDNLEIREETEEKAPETVADQLRAQGLTKDEIADALREVLKAAAPAPEVDAAAAEKAYFSEFIK